MIWKLFVHYWPFVPFPSWRFLLWLAWMIFSKKKRVELLEIYDVMSLMFQLQDSRIISVEKSYQSFKNNNNASKQNIKSFAYWRRYMLICCWLAEWSSWSSPYSFISKPLNHCLNQSCLLNWMRHGGTNFSKVCITFDYRNCHIWKSFEDIKPWVCCHEYTELSYV